MRKREMIEPRYVKKWKLMPLCEQQAVIYIRYGENIQVPSGSQKLASIDCYIRQTGETQYVPKGKCERDGDGKRVLMTYWESDRLIVPKKLGNANGGKEPMQ